MSKITEVRSQKSEVKKIHKRKRSGGKSAAEIAEAEIIETQAEAAKFIGKSTRTVRRWEREGMLVATQNGRKVYIRSQLKLFSEHEGKQPTKARSRRDEGEADFKEIRAKLAKLELEKELGQLVNREEFEKKNIKKILAIKSGIFLLVRTIVSALPAEHRLHIKKLAEKEARTLIEGFSR